MRCPHADTARKLVFDREGNAFCPNCNPRPRGDRRVYTGRKVWHAYDAYGVKKTIEMNKEWGENMAKRAAEMRRRTHHAGFRR